MTYNKRTHVLALTFSLLSIVWVSSATGLLPASAGSIEDRIRARMERREKTHESAPSSSDSSQSSKAPLVVTVRGPQNLPLNGTVLFTITATNKMHKSAADVKAEHLFQAEGYDDGNSFLSLIPERSDKRCTASTRGVGCKLGTIAPAGKTSVTLAYRVVRCVPGYNARAIVSLGGNNAMMAVAKNTTGVVTGCSPSDRSL